MIFNKKNLWLNIIVNRIKQKKNPIPEFESQNDTNLDTHLSFRITHPFLAHSVQFRNELRQIVLILVLFLVPQFRQSIQNCFGSRTPTPTADTAGPRTAPIGRRVREQIQQLVRAHRLHFAVVAADYRVDSLNFELLQAETFFKLKKNPKTTKTTITP